MMDCDELVLRLVHSYVHRHLGGKIAIFWGNFFVGRSGGCLNVEKTCLPFFFFVCVCGGGSGGWKFQPLSFFFFGGGGNSNMCCPTKNCTPTKTT